MNVLDPTAGCGWINVNVNTLVVKNIKSLPTAMICSEKLMRETDDYVLKLQSSIYGGAYVI